MTLKQLLDGLKGCDSFDLYNWITFLSEKISCRDCVDLMLTKDRIPDCGKCIPSKTLIIRAKTTLEERSKNNGKKNQIK